MSYWAGDHFLVSRPAPEDQKIILAIGVFGLIVSAGRRLCWQPEYRMRRPVFSKGLESNSISFKVAIALMQSRCWAWLKKKKRTKGTWLSCAVACNSKYDLGMNCGQIVSATLGSFIEIRISGPTSELMNQNLHF